MTDWLEEVKARLEGMDFIDQAEEFEDMRRLIAEVERLRKFEPITTAQGYRREANRIYGELGPVPTTVPLSERMNTIGGSPPKLVGIEVGRGWGKTAMAKDIDRLREALVEERTKYLMATCEYEVVESYFTPSRKCQHGYDEEKEKAAHPGDIWLNLFAAYHDKVAREQLKKEGKL